MKVMKGVGTRLFNEIQKAIEKNSIIIVEGKKDKVALQQLGFRNIIVLHGRAFYKKIEEIVMAARKFKKEVIILTDLDKKGKQFYIRIKKELTKEGIRTDDRLRKMLTREKISHVEGFVSFVEKHI